MADTQDVPRTIITRDLFGAPQQTAEEFQQHALAFLRFAAENLHPDHGRAELTRDMAQAIATRIGELEAERDALRADAERYAYMQRMADYVAVHWTDPDERCVSGAYSASELDAAIDQAQGKSQP
jgi:hypothetical protein